MSPAACSDMDSYKFRLCAEGKRQNAGGNLTFSKPLFRCNLRSLATNHKAPS